MSGFYRMITALMFISAVFTWVMGKLPHTEHINPNPPVLTTQTERHILYGNGRGSGGHLHGQNGNCKSEFPADWNAAKIIRTVRAEAANDNEWRPSKNGYQTAESNVEGVRIRIVVNGKNNEIVTAYPVNGPRNACFNE